MGSINKLRQLGQSLWLDNITRDMLDSGQLEEYIKAWQLTGLTSNPSIFQKAVTASDSYAEDIRQKAAAGKSSEALFIELALDDLRRAAALFAPVHAQTKGVDGWVSMEVSPLLANNTEATVASAKAIHKQADCKNLFIKIPGTPEGVPAIEEAIFSGVPINVTLLFSTAQYQAVADAYMRALERRLDAGLSLDIASVASVFISRWDVAVADKIDDTLRNKLGIAVAGRVYRAYLDVLASDRWQALEARGAKPQRLLWASTGAKDPDASDTLYVDTLAAPDTINTLPDKTAAAVADHGRVDTPLSTDSAGAEAVLSQFAKAGVEVDALAQQLQREGADAFVQAWKKLLARIDEQCR